GGILFVFFISYVAPRMNLFTHQTMATVGEHALNYSYTILFLSSVIAGWLMGLLSWLISSVDNSITRFIFVFMITGIIGLSGFHYGIVVNLAFFCGFLFSEAISFTDYLIFVIIAFVGNGVGGAIVVAWFTYRVFTDTDCCRNALLLYQS